jgi:hypothetical protein
MMKLLNQFEHVESATPFALRELGNISDGMAHGTGPQVAPNENMYRNRKATATHPSTAKLAQRLPNLPTSTAMTR